MKKGYFIFTRSNIETLLLNMVDRQSRNVSITDMTILDDDGDIALAVTVMGDDLPDCCENTIAQLRYKLFELASDDKFLGYELQIEGIEDENH